MPYSGANDLIRCKYTDEDLFCVCTAGQTVRHSCIMDHIRRQQIDPYILRALPRPLIYAVYTPGLRVVIFGAA